MLKLTSILKTLGQLYKALYTANKKYIMLPGENGLKICWGSFGDAMYGSEIILPITFVDGIGMAFPTYNTGSTMICNFSSNYAIRNTNRFAVVAYDVHTMQASTSRTLAGTYLVIGY